MNKNKRDYQLIYYPESTFGGFSDIDGSIAFYMRVNALLSPSSIVLDVGCGRGKRTDDSVSIRKNLCILKGKCKKVIGLDLDENAQSNPLIDEFLLLKDNHWPLKDGSADVCICDNVIEHVEEPEMFFSELGRVIKSDGYICIRTPNAFSYFGILSRMLPSERHADVVVKAQSNRKDCDIFPTLYRCNTISKIKILLNKYGFDNCVYGYEAEPSYLSFSRAIYALGTVIHRFTPNMFKTTIFAFGKKR